MRKYSVCLYGSSVTRRLEYEVPAVSDKFAIENVERSLVHYFPVYTKAAVWSADNDEDLQLVAEFSVDVKVTTTVKGA